MPADAVNSYHVSFVNNYIKQGTHMFVHSVTGLGCGPSLIALHESDTMCQYLGQHS